MQTAKSRYGVGASLLRKEDDRHLAGAASSSSDIRLPGTQQVVFLRSPHAHARIRGIAVPPEARGRVFTAADLPRMQPIRVVTQAAGAKSPPWPPLATDKARYVGEAIAACVAPTRAEAEDLAAAVAVDFEVLDAVVDAPRDDARRRRPGARIAGATTSSASARWKAATSTRRRAPPTSSSPANTA